MKRIKVILFVFSLLMVMPIVNAQCDYREKSRLQGLASNLDFTYNYKETDNGINSNVDFSITIANTNPELYIVDQTNIGVYYYNNQNEITINNYKPGSTIQFIVYGNTVDCKGVELINNYITLPSYNRFYKDSVCENVSGYKLCKRWTKVDLSYDEFVKKVEEYKEKIKAEEIPSVQVKLDLIEKIIVFLSKYSFYLFGGIIILCSGLIFYLSHKDDFDLK